MATISIQANTVRPSVDRRSNDTAFGAGTFSWQNPVHSWKAGPGEVITEIFIYYVLIRLALIYNSKCLIIFGHKMKIPTIVSVRISEMEMKSVCTFLPAQINHVELATVVFN